MSTEGKVSRNSSGRAFRNSSGRLIRNKAVCSGCDCEGACQSSVFVNAFPEDDYFISRGWNPIYLTGEFGTGTEGAYPAFIDVTISGVLNGSAAASGLDGLKVTCGFNDGTFHATDPSASVWKWSCLNEITWCGMKVFDPPINVPKLDGSGTVEINNIQITVRLAVFAQTGPVPSEELAPCHYFPQVPYTEVEIRANVFEGDPGILAFIGWENQCFKVNSLGVWFNGTPENPAWPTANFIVRPGPARFTPWGSAHSDLCTTCDCGRCLGFLIGDPYISQGPVDEDAVEDDELDPNCLTDKQCLAYSKYRQLTISCTPAVTSDDTCRLLTCGGYWPVCCRYYDITLIPTLGGPIKDIDNPVRLTWTGGDDPGGFWTGEVEFSGDCSMCVDDCWSSDPRIGWVYDINLYPCDYYMELMGGFVEVVNRFNSWDPTEYRHYVQGTDELGDFIGLQAPYSKWWIAQTTGWSFLTGDAEIADGTWYSKIYAIIKFDCYTGVWTIEKEMLVKSDDVTTEGWTQGQIYSFGKVTYTQTTGTGAAGAEAGSFDDSFVDSTTAGVCAGDIELEWTDEALINIDFLDNYQNECSNVVTEECYPRTSGPGYMEIRCMSAGEGEFEAEWVMTLIMDGNYTIWRAKGALTPTDTGYCPPIVIDPTRIGLVWELEHDDWVTEELAEGAVTLQKISGAGCVGEYEAPEEE